MRFPSTKWNIVDSLKRGTSDERGAAMAEVMGVYGKPLYAFLRCDYTKDTSEDFVQSFFQDCLERDILQHADASKGRFRSFLLSCLKHFIVNQIRDEHAKKRSPVGGLLSLEELIRVAGPASEPRVGESPEAAFHRTWLEALLHQILQKYSLRCSALHMGERYDVFRLRVVEAALDNSPVASFAELGSRFRISENAANKAVLKAKSDLCRLAEAEVRQYAISEQEVADDVGAVLNMLTVR